MSLKRRVDEEYYAHLLDEDYPDDPHPDGCFWCGSFDHASTDCQDRDDYYPEDRPEDYPEYDGIHFADPGGRSALRAATEDNPRNLPCPTCGRRDRLTPADRALGYQCDACADQMERGW